MHIFNVYVIYNTLTNSVLETSDEFDSPYIWGDIGLYTTSNIPLYDIHKSYEMASRLQRRGRDDNVVFVPLHLGEQHQGELDYSNTITVSDYIEWYTDN